jgi:hypothetical protein
MNGSRKICGVSHNTVRSYVKARQDGAQAPVARQRGRMTDPFLPQMISWVEQSRYSVPHTLMGQMVWVRRTETEVVIVHVGDSGPLEVARHRLTRPGTPAIIETHFPPAPVGALERAIRPTNKAEEEFLALGAGAALWLKEAAAAGTGKIRHKMERAVTLAKVLGADEVDKGLGAAAVHQRFTHEDLISIVNTGNGKSHTTGATHTVTDQGRWLSQGTSAWANFGSALNTASDEDFEGAIDER